MMMMASQSVAMNTSARVAVKAGALFRQARGPRRRPRHRERRG
jgi:hypothetical protein